MFTTIILSFVIGSIAFLLFTGLVFLPTVRGGSLSRLNKHDGAWWAFATFLIGLLWALTGIAAILPVAEYSLRGYDSHRFMSIGSSVSNMPDLLREVRIFEKVTTLIEFFGYRAFAMFAFMMGTFGGGIMAYTSYRLWKKGGLR
jgi:hypothetical protein